MRIVCLYEDDWVVRNVKENLLFLAEQEKIKVKSKNVSHIKFSNGVFISFKLMNENRATDLLRIKKKYNDVIFIGYEEDLNSKNIDKIEERIKEKLNILYLKDVFDFINILLTTEYKTHYKIKDFDIIEIQVREHKLLYDMDYNFYHKSLEECKKELEEDLISSIKSQESEIRFLRQRTEETIKTREKKIEQYKTKLEQIKREL